MPSGYDPMGGRRFSDKIMLQQKIERDDDSKKSHAVLGAFGLFWGQSGPGSQPLRIQCRNNLVGVGTGQTLE